MPGDLAGALPSGMPTVQRFASGSGTYVPTSLAVTWIRVRMVAGGGGGGVGTTVPAGAVEIPPLQTGPVLAVARVKAHRELRAAAVD